MLPSPQFPVSRLHLTRRRPRTRRRRHPRRRGQRQQAVCTRAGRHARKRYAACNLCTIRARAITERNLSAVHNSVLAQFLSTAIPTQFAEEPPPLPDIPEETLRSAMKTYRKRMKLMKLDHESKLGRSPLTSGKDAGFESILPPEEFAPEVWQVLAARGELEATGQGFYKLPTERPSF